MSLSKLVNNRIKSLIYSKMLFSNKLVAAAALAVQFVEASTILLSPDAQSDGTPLAVVWVLGADYQAS